MCVADTSPERTGVRVAHDGVAHDGPVSDRLRRIVERLDVQPRDRILEIGCGHGVAIGLICERLDGGVVTAIDRSPKMIDAARRRNAHHAAEGTVELLVGALEDIDLGARRFDKVLAARIGLFHREPERARALASRWLAPGGNLYMFYDAPAATG